MKKQFRNVSMVIGSLLALSIFPASAHDGTKLRARMVPHRKSPSSPRKQVEFEARIESDSLISFKMSYEGLEGA